MKNEDEAGVIVALLKRLAHERAPRLIGLKEKVDKGERPNNTDIEYLTMAIKDAQSAMPLADRYPEYQDIAKKVVSLHQEITVKILELENKD